MTCGRYAICKDAYDAYSHNFHIIKKSTTMKPRCTFTRQPVPKLEDVDGTPCLRLSLKWAVLLLVLTLAVRSWATTENDPSQSKREAEYYVAVYARHYQVPLEFVRAIVSQESGWQRCAVSRKGAAGLMQLMPGTAARLNVRNRCDISQNVSGGVRYLAWLMNKFHGDLRLVAAAYYAGEGPIGRRGLGYSNPNVVAYVASVRERYEREKHLQEVNSQSIYRRSR
ncbi:MAG TPA: lytic transglycosylase domain-containing protein [Candidatus Angelobacter sp.]|nr:lytic transglycosylase domain-containing protein [Candidatus Angelobacter sp.]